MNISEHPDITLAGTSCRGSTQFDFDLSIPGGQRVAVVGPNGSGKTTLLRIIAGLERLDTGMLRVGDAVLDRPETNEFVTPDQRDVVLQHQRASLFENLDVSGNVAFALRASGMGRRDAQRRATDVLDAFELSDLSTRRPSSLSGGQAARVALARTVASGAPVMLLDEPLAAVDVEARPWLRRMIDDLSSTLLVVTHDPVMARFGDSIVVVSEGSIAQAGPLKTIAAEPANRWIAGFFGHNLLSGVASGSTVRLENGAVMYIGDQASGTVHVSFSPRAVTLHRDRPEGSARNVWPITVQTLHTDDNRVRVDFVGTIDASALVTAGAVTDLELAPGARCWASVKATELSIIPG